MDLNHIFKEDQGNEAIRGYTRIFAVYYLSMIEQGIPPDLAASLTSDYHWVTNCASTFKSGQYPPRS